MRLSSSTSGMWKRGMVWIVRHRQTKEPDTDRPNLNHRATSRLHHFRCTLETVAQRQPVEHTGVASINPRTAESEKRDRPIGQMACRLCLDYWGTRTCVVSSRPACIESAEDPIKAQRDSGLGD
jgi:hypothetical protein